MITKSIHNLLELYPFAKDFFSENNLAIEGHEHLTVPGFLETVSDEHAEEFAIDKKKLAEDFVLYIEMMQQFIEDPATKKIDSITILPGFDKARKPENFERIVLRRAEIISIVGPTGSGKSRLLADIEWMANGDTPTGRKILINDAPADMSLRFSTQNKLVAQLSQNMNFVMDLTVHEFLSLHADSRMISNTEALIEKIITTANDLAGEKFDYTTPITALSGGQSRALMISDTAILCSSPIILIDEIENAGIDRHKALDVLLNEEKIVLMATHDPALALNADKRIVINNGGIANILTTSQEEKKILERLNLIDEEMKVYRKKLRYGEQL